MVCSMWGAINESTLVGTYTQKQAEDGLVGIVLFGSAFNGRVCVGVSVPIGVRNFNDFRALNDDFLSVQVDLFGRGNLQDVISQANGSTLNVRVVLLDGGSHMNIKASALVELFRGKEDQVTFSLTVFYKKKVWYLSDKRYP